MSSALAFMRDIGAAFSPDAPPPDHMRQIYARHASRLLPRHPRSFCTCPCQRTPGNAAYAAEVDIHAESASA